MPPAAVDVRSRFQSSNRNPNWDHQETVMKSPVFGDASDFVANDGGSASRNGTRTHRVGRMRPRMVKVRKQLHNGSSKAESGELGFGVSNPFHFRNSENGSVDCDINALNLESGERVIDLKAEQFSSKVECVKLRSDFDENEGRSVGKVDEKVNSPCFVFGAKQSDVTDNEGKPVLKEVNENLRNCGSVFGGSKNGVEIELDLEKMKSRESVLDSGLEAEAEFGKNNFAGFEFGVDKSNPAFSFGKGGKSNSDGASPDSDNVRFMFGASHNSSSTSMGVRGTNFVFGAAFNLNDKKEGGGETAHGVKFDMNGNRNIAVDKDEVPFAFGSSYEDGSCLGKCMENCLDKMKSSSKIFGNCIDSNISCHCKHPSSQNSIKVDKMYNRNPAVDLSDDMNKMHIDGFKNVNIGKSSENDDSVFVFRAASPSRGLGPTCERKSGLCGAAEGNVGEQFESTDKNGRSKSGSSSVGTSCSETFIVQEENGSINGGQLGGSGPSEPPHVASVGQKNNSSYTLGSSDRLGVPFADFTAPDWDPSWFKASLFTEVNKKLDFSVKGRSQKDKKSKTMRRKLKHLSQHKQQAEQGHLENKSSAQEALNSLGCYSPMDFSPYEEATAPELSSRDTSMVSNDSIHMDNHYESSVLHSAVAGNLKNVEISSLDKGDKPNHEGSLYHSEKCFSCDSPAKVFGFEMPCSDCETKQAYNSNGAGVGCAQDAFAFNTGSSHQTQFGFAPGLEDVDGRKFAFSASSSTAKSVSAVKHANRRINRRKAASKPSVLALNPNAQDQQGDLLTSQRAPGNNFKPNDLVKQGSATSTNAIQEACETWRLRGNHAYKNGDLSKAEDSYTRGIESVPCSEISGGCLEPLVVCYSNRAATRMSLGNMREALKDCAMAAALDPRFLKVQIRAANCHLALGEIEEAESYFNRCLESGGAVCLDRRITIEAAEGLQKSQKVAELMKKSAKLLDERTSDAALSALDVIAEALSVSPYSEKLLEMKAASILMLRRYEEVIQLCEQTLHAAEKNFTSSGTDNQFVDKDGSLHSYARLWRWHLVSKSHFYMGRLEMALDLVENLNQIGSTTDKTASKILESSVSLAATIRALVHHKSSGNEAVRSGRYPEALDHYTAAISINIESRAFAAICFCNRAAAHQALNQIADAIADCSLAIALDGHYSKAVARRAALHEMIRDFGQAANDLRRLISVLENMSDGKQRQSGTPSNSTSRSKELKQARRRLSLMEEEAKNGKPLDFYLILGVEQSDSAADIKKAYRKAALRHHPDKACQFLSRSESGDEGWLWKDIVQEVHMDADMLFKLIGEAYAVLSDPTMRSEYDLNEEIRKSSKEYKESRPPRRPSSDDHYNYSYRKKDFQRNWHDTGRTYGHSHARW